MLISIYSFLLSLLCICQLVFILLSLTDLHFHPEFLSFPLTLPDTLLCLILIIPSVFTISIFPLLSLSCTLAIQDESMKISQYQLLLNRLPHVNKATLQALINHLYWWVTHNHTCRNPLVSVCLFVQIWAHCPSMSFSVQRFSEMNQMNLHNLAIVFGPTLFQTDGKDYTAGRAIEDLIQHYTSIFEVRLTAQWQTGWWQEGLTFVL